VVAKAVIQSGADMVACLKRKKKKKKEEKRRWSRAIKAVGMFIMFTVRVEEGTKLSLVTAETEGGCRDKKVGVGGREADCGEV
jgi:hypothetical protein